MQLHALTMHRLSVVQVVTDQFSSQRLLPSIGLGLGGLASKGAPLLAHGKNSMVDLNLSCSFQQKKPSHLRDVMVIKARKTTFFIFVLRSNSLKRKSPRKSSEPTKTAFRETVLRDPDPSCSPDQVLSRPNTVGTFLAVWPSFLMKHMKTAAVGCETGQLIQLVPKKMAEYRLIWYDVTDRLVGWWSSLKLIKTWQNI